MTETLLHVTARPRSPSRLDDPELDAPDPSIAALSARAAQADGELVVTGGEPTLRADLPALLGALRAPTLRTDALALASAPAIKALRDAGMARLRVVLHSARPDAHDWLVGQPGAAKLAMRALLRAAELGLPTEIEATLTRPTAPHVSELVVLAEGVGARAVRLVGLRQRGLAAREAIMLAPRLALLEDPLDLAALAAIRARVELVVHDLPRCACARHATIVAPPGARRHAFADEPAWGAIAAAYETGDTSRCPSCPGAASCVGVPAAYIARFGAAEVASQRPRVERPRDPAAAATGPAPTAVAPRAGRAPITRLSDLRAVVRRGAVEGDPLIDRPEAPLPALRFSFAPISTGTRVLRARLIRASEEGASVLRISGGFDHPSLHPLLREAARLPGPEVELAGDLRPLAALTDAQIFEITGIARTRAALFSPADVAPALALLERLTRIAKIATSAFVVIRDPSELAGWAAHFDALPDATVRLAGHGSLDALVEAAQSLAPSRLSDEVLRLVARPLALSSTPPPPPLAPAFVDGLANDAPLLDEEPFGAFDPCPCADPGCPGVAVGWTSTRLEGQVGRADTGSRAAP